MLKFCRAEAIYEDQFTSTDDKVLSMLDRLIGESHKMFNECIKENNQDRYCHDSRFTFHLFALYVAKSIGRDILDVEKDESFPYLHIKEASIHLEDVRRCTADIERSNHTIRRIIGSLLLLLGLNVKQSIGIVAV